MLVTLIWSNINAKLRGCTITKLGKGLKGEFGYCVMLAIETYVLLRTAEYRQKRQGDTCKNRKSYAKGVQAFRVDIRNVNLEISMLSG